MGEASREAVGNFDYCSRELLELMVLCRLLQVLKDKSAGG